MSHKKLKTAVIGVGKMGTYHAKIYEAIKSINLVAGYTKSTSKAEDKKKELDIPMYTDLGKLLEGESPDLVSIATPTITHKRIAIKCLESGSHVLLEKPIAMNVQDAKEINRIAKQSRKKLMIGHIERFNPVTNKAQEIIQKKLIGKILLYDAFRSTPLPLKPNSSVLLDLGIHDFDLVKYIINSKLKKSKPSMSVGRRISIKQHDDLHSVIAETESGVVFLYSTDWLRKKIMRQTSIIGTDGELHLDFQNKKLTLVSEKEKDIRINKKINQLELEIKAFIRCIRNNTVSPITADDAIDALEFYEACA